MVHRELKTSNHTGKVQQLGTLRREVYTSSQHFANKVSETQMLLNVVLNPDASSHKFVDYLMATSCYWSYLLINVSDYVSNRWQETVHLCWIDQELKL